MVVDGGDEGEERLLVDRLFVGPGESGVASALGRRHGRRTGLAVEVVDEETVLATGCGDGIGEVIRVMGEGEVADVLDLGFGARLELDEPQRRAEALLFLFFLVLCSLLAGRLFAGTFFTGTFFTGTFFTGAFFTGLAGRGFDGFHLRGLSWLALFAGFTFDGFLSGSLFSRSLLSGGFRFLARLLRMQDGEVPTVV